MKKTIIALSLAAMTLPAMAQKAAEPAYTFEGNFTVTSDYIFRGYTQSNGAAAIQGGFDLSFSNGFYLGTWASSVAGVSTGGFLNVELPATFVDAAPGASLETNFYGGYTFTAGEIEIDLGLLRYYYPKQDTGGAKWDTTEAYVGLSYGPVGLKISRAMTSYFGGLAEKGTMYYALTGSYPIFEGVSLNGHYGYNDLKNSSFSNFKDYKLGLSTELGGYTLAADYIGTSPKQEKSKVVLSVSKSF